MERAGRGFAAVACRLGAAVWFAVVVPVALALEPSTSLANYTRQTWVMENGLPQNTVQAMVQGKDGFIWLGTEAGLVRFDGNSFAIFDRNSRPALPGSDIRCLLAAGDGSLWIGTSEGLARWKSGAVTEFTTGNGLPANGIHALAETRGGGILAWTDQGLARLSGQRFEAAGEWRPGAAVLAVSESGQVASWSAGAFGNDHWAHNLARVGAAKEGTEFLAALPGGIVAAASKGGLVLEKGSSVLERLTPGHGLPGSRIQVLFADREGSLWVGTNGGLARWGAGKWQNLPVTDPLATASVLTIMEDSEGDLWVGTETGGLHILRDQRFRTAGTREGLSSDATTAVVEDRSGMLWVGTSSDGLNGYKPDGKSRAKNYSVRNGLASDVILALAAAPNGDLWVGTPDGLNRIRKGVIAYFTSADGLPDDFIRSLLADADGSLWVGTRRGLMHWTGDPAAGQNHTHMETFTHANGLGSDLVGAMAHDKEGSLWVATFAGLSRLKGGKITNYTTSDGLASNVVTSLLPRADGTLLIGTQDHGWSVWDGGHFKPASRNGLDRATIHAMLDDGHNHLWFATGNGIARCDCDMMGGCSHWMEFSTADGLRSRDTATNSHPSAWRSMDGRLWFATPKGLVEVDPAHFPVNRVPPPVAIERFSVDDVEQGSDGAMRRLVVPAGHVHFQFDYAGMSFAAPQKVRYRYRLDGFDRGWTEAGLRRTAYYTNIPPGRYTFRVEAANNDGVWNTEGAALEFELRPHFYQTVWFYILLAVTAAGFVVLLLKRRLYVAEREFNAVLAERTRIAREIHDTLAQGYVGISVQLEVLAELLRLNKTDAAAKHLDATRGYVREGLTDARQSIWALRSQDAAETTLPVRMRRLVETDGTHGLEAKFNIHGAYRPLPPGTEQEILRVAQEAIHNAKKHAGAKQLAVQLEYDTTVIALEVRDDGRGFAINGKPESPAGHYGLTGMRERAAAIGGTLEITSEPGAGTVVRLCAPAPREPRDKAGD